MTTTRSVSVPRLEVDADQLGYFRFGRLGDGVILTNEHGEWHHLAEATFRELLAGRIGADHPDREALAAKGVLREGLDLQHAAGAIRRRKRYVGAGPSVHVLHLGEDGQRLSVERAKDILDFAMLSTASALEFRLVPDGAPDLDLLGFIVQYASEKNRYEGKALSWRLDVAPALLDDAMVSFVVDKRFRVRAPLTGTSLSDADTDAVARIHQAAAAKKRDGWAVEALVQVDAENVGALAQIIDHLHGRGVRRLRLAPLLTGDTAVSASAWAQGFRGALARLLALHAAGEAPVEEFTEAIVTRASRTDAGAELDARSPSGTGTIVYDVRGRLFPSEAARTADEPDMFALGTAGETSYKDATSHGTLRALTLASLLECLPGFADHWATPYLGVDPVASFATTGDLFPKAPTSPQVTVQLTAVEAVFEVLAAAGEDAERLRSWIA